MIKVVFVFTAGLAAILVGSFCVVYMIGAMIVDWVVGNV
jgi:hypothetical protein